jgi:ribosome recycling factor
MKEEKERIDYRKIIEKVKPEMERAVKAFEEEVKTIRSSRASPELVENLQVECFGQKFLLRQLGQISIPEPRQILISPWDSSYIEPIVKAIEKSGLGASPTVNGNSIRITLPPVTEEFKKNLLRILSQKKEAAKKKIREARTDWGYAPEYIEAMWKMLQKEKPDDYVIGTGEWHSVKEFLEEAFSYVGLKWEDYVKIDKEYLRPIDVENLRADFSKAKKEIGWEPKIKFKELVKIMMDAEMRINGITPVGEGDKILKEKFPNRWWIKD